MASLLAIPLAFALTATPPAAPLGKLGPATIRSRADKRLERFEEGGVLGLLGFTGFF